MIAVRRRSEQGVVLVEAAFAFPLLILFFLGLVDTGLWVFQRTQASGAARDGARMGILAYRQADVPTSADAAAIRDAIVRRVGSQPFGAALSVQVTCVGPADTVPLTGGCSNATVLDRDRIQVTVSWLRRPMSFVTLAFGTSQTVTGQAVMVIQDRPPGVSAGP